ncbi:hypothetical protein ACFY9R_03525 [Streptomyces albidoflavus]|uniref:hypothetical protein n=1 Tax=Streptomyces albidoflavus TaxID=1886 RepID=UPI00340C4FBD
MPDLEPDEPLAEVMTCEVFGTLRLHPWFTETGLEEDFYSLAVKRAQAYGWTTTLHSAGTEPDSIRWHHAEAAQDWSQDGQIRRLAALEIYPVAPRGQALPILPVTQIVTDCLDRVGKTRLTSYRYQLPVHLAADPGTDAADGDAWFALSPPAAAVQAEITAELPLSAQDKIVDSLSGGNVLNLGQGHPAPQAGSGHPPEYADEPATRPWTWPLRLPEWSPSAVAWATAALCDVLRETYVRYTTIRVDHRGLRGSAPRAPGES